MTQIKVAIKDFTLEMDWTRFDNAPESFKTKFFQDGVLDALTDSHASIKDRDEKIARVEAKLASLYRFEESMDGALTRSADPVARFAKQIAETRVKKAINGDVTRLRELVGDRVKWSIEPTDEEKKSALALLIKAEMDLPAVRAKAESMAEMFADATADL